jgi:hypothetical protein
MSIISALLLLQASTSPQASVPPATSILPDAISFLRSQGFSEAGIAVLARQTGGRERMERFSREGEALSRELSAAIRQPRPDVVRIGEILRRRDILLANLMSMRTGEIVETLASLPPADRKIYLRPLDPLPPEGQELPTPIAPPAPPAPPAAPPRR